MIAVIVGHEYLFDFFRIKTVIPNVGNDFLKVTVYTAARINNREFRSAVDDINVTVQPSGNAESVMSPTYHMDVTGEFH